MFTANGRLVLRADAIFDAVLGCILLAATWDDLYEALDLPHAEPEVFTQMAGGLLIAYSYLLWIAPTNRFLAIQMALLTGIVNVVAVVLLAVWLSSGELNIGDFGSILLNVISAVLAVLAALELGLFRRLAAETEEE
ncbi:MAG TPA: hypothetical protein VFZ12_04830 [Dehalococcoidia bacterium]|nr:hypothetical protein [Dehalococcoidia bacterium]